MGSLQYFLKTYLSAAFPLPFSDDQKQVIAKIERAVETGGKFAEAMPRGSGKSTICEGATLWAALKGSRKFVVFIGAVADFGIAAVDSLASEFEHNDLLLADFPEVVFPFRALEQSNNRARGQRCMGVLTEIRRTSGKLVFPTIAGSSSSGVVVFGTGIEGGKLRGLRHKLPSGEVRRPDFIIGDDLQTDETAQSPVECAKREKAITGKILGMAGPGMLPAAIVCGTVIRRGDVMDNLLDRQKHPEWQGERMKLIYSFPADIALWDEYARIYAEDLATGGTGSKATAFYRQRRERMDAGAIIAWRHRKAAGELSAIEHAMRLFYRDRDVFFAEYQNEPKVEEAVARIMAAEQIAAKQNGYERRAVPSGCEHLTAFIDVHMDLLYWALVALADDFTGYVIDYGVHPEQSRSYFMLRDARPTLADAARRTFLARGLKDGGMEASIYEGLDQLTKALAASIYLRDDGAEMRVERIGIDANWGQTTSLVKQFCRQSLHAALLIPSHGHSYSARHKPLSQYQRKAGERLDREYMWHVPKAPPRQVRHVAWDTNWWKSFFHARLSMPLGAPGSLSLFRHHDHRLIAEHFTAELPTPVETPDRKLDEWILKPGVDNHWLDCVVGCLMLGAMQGCRLAALSRTAPKQRMTLAELARRAKRGV